MHAPDGCMGQSEDRDRSKIGAWEGRASGISGGAPGAPLWAPDHDVDAADEHTSAPSTGSLATSGREDVLRGDTVTGLGAADIGQGTSTGRRHAVPPGPQSGSPTPGNRYTGEATEDDED